MEDDDVKRAAKLLSDGDAAEDPSRNGGRGPAVDPSGYYARLGVGVKATPQEIRRAFLSLSQRYHTDKHANQGDTLQGLMNERFQELQDAYTVLSDARQRAAYDAGGDTGVQRLALVPAGLHKPEEVLNYVLSLDREAQLLRTAQLLSATSQTTMTFSTAHLFSFRQLSEAAAGAGSGSDEAAKDNDVTAGEAPAATPITAPSPSSPSPSPPPQDGSSSSSPPPAEPRATAPAAPAAPAAPSPAAPPASPASSASSAAAPGGTAAAPAAAAASAGGKSAPPGAVAMQAQLSAREVIIDGQRQIVLIPSQEVQRQLRQRMGEATAAATASQPGNGDAAVRAAASPRRRLSMAQAIVLAVVPKSMTFRSSFQHLVTPRLSLTFRTDATARRQQTSSSLTTLVEYHPDEVRTYQTSLRMAVHGLKWCVMQTRALSPLWTLKSKLTLLTGSALLQKLELTLSRQMSATAVLENVLAMSLTEHGFFRTSLNDLAEDAQQGVSAYMAFHNAYVTAFTGRKVVFGVDTKDPQHPPAHGQLQYSVNCSPLAGQSTFGIEAWYVSSQTQRYGLAFTAVVPYAVSPIAPPLFLVRSTQFAVVNQVSLLYARGRHRISVPVIVFISPKLSYGLVWLSAPLALYRIGSMLYRPYARAKAIRYYTEQRKLHIAETDVAREKARMEQLALESLVLASRASEERKGGLIVINARYGVMEPQFAEVARPPTPPPAPARSASNTATPTRAATPPFTPARPRAKTSASSSGWWPSQVMARVAERLVQGWMRRRSAAAAAAAADNGDDAFEARHDAVRSDAIPLSIDVTIAVQNLVRDSALTLPAGTKSVLVGFCDPDPHTPEQKKLKILYWFRKRKHMAVFNDDEEVELPQRDHLIRA
ncbi:DnaJ domain (DUF3395) [Novymonas esmeraldas]|uniref:DnaJ domain (DUF3395) n=1 Tax=Novymonas esmeraldas TaxID=1808958 RepID=A0AAW0F6C2_9TRYP